LVLGCQWRSGSIDQLGSEFQSFAINTLELASLTGIEPFGQVVPSPIRPPLERISGNRIGDVDVF
jgi:hypothetical protein